MGSPLVPALANIIMIEFENAIVKELVDKSIVKLYMRYFNDKLLLVKDKDINYIHKRLNSFDKNIKFIADTFPDGNVHFLDIKVDKIILTFTIKILIQGNTQASTVKHSGI